MFFHQGRSVPEPARINVIEPHGEPTVTFDPALFDYGHNKIEPASLSKVSYNGFRVHFSVNRPSYEDDVLVFQAPPSMRPAGVAARSAGL